MKKYLIACICALTLASTGCNTATNPVDTNDTMTETIVHPSIPEDMPILTRMLTPINVILESCMNLSEDQRRICNINRSELLEMKKIEEDRITSLNEIQRAKDIRVESLDRLDPDFAIKFKSIDLEYDGKKQEIDEIASIELKSLSLSLSQSFREVLNAQQKRMWNEWIVLNRKPC